MTRIFSKKGGEETIRKPRMRSFGELVNENKRLLLSDQAAIEKIEERLEEKHLRKLNSNFSELKFRGTKGN